MPSLPMINKEKYLLFFIMYVFPSLLFAQITWEKTIPWGFKVPVYDSKQTIDSGYIMVGEHGFGGIGGNDALIFKLDKYGTEQWYTAFGGNEYDVAYSVALSSDSGYVVTGYTRSFSSSNAYRLFISKFNSSGHKVWSKIYGKPGSVLKGFSIDVLPEGGYVIAGAVDKDMLILKTDNNGDTIWTKRYGDPSETAYEDASSIQRTNDGNYIVAGNAGVEFDDFIIMKVKSNGDTLWTKKFGDPSPSVHDHCNKVIQTTDGGYILAGFTESSVFMLPGANLRDPFIIKLDGNGMPVKAVTYQPANARGGLMPHEQAFSIQKCSGGGYIVSATMAGVRSSIENMEDFYAMRLDEDLNVSWAKTFPGLKILGVAPMLAEVIRHIEKGQSVTDIYKQ